MGGSPSRILPNLFLGGASTLSDEVWFAQNNITHAVSVCDMTPAPSIRLQRLHINKDDVPSTNLEENFAQVIEFVHRARLSGSGVYIHCAAGISRSSTMTIAYLVTSLDFSVSQALDYCVSQRQQVCPNHGFLEQLNHYFGSDEWRRLKDRLASLEEFSEEAKQELKQLDIEYIKQNWKDIEVSHSSEEIFNEQRSKLREQIASREEVVENNYGLSWVRDTN